MNALQFEYQPDYPGPAIPVAEIDIHGPTDSRTVVAVIDSGADATLIPLPVLEAIRTEIIDTRWARNISGGRYRVAIYLADISIGQFLFPDIEVVANHQTDEIVLGRDVLNEVITKLDGPARRVFISDG